MSTRTRQVPEVTGPRRTAKSQQTRSHILKTAQRLFNERGTAAVSTNHVAAAAGLSPGNLYYHFADKQEIIRALHDRYAAAHEELWQAAAGATSGLAGLRANVSTAMQLAWQYRFFERERLALLRADPELLASYRTVYQRRLGQWLAYGELLAAEGTIRLPRPPATIADLAVAVWLIGESWLSYLEITGDPEDPAQVARGADLVLAVLNPYLATAEPEMRDRPRGGQRGTPHASAQPAHRT
jgi:AcrR family transcriptional regulator